MNQNGHRPPDPAGEDALLAYGDRLAAGERPAPASELEALALRVQQALAAPEPTLPAMPPALKQSIWEEIMQSTTRTAGAGAPSRPRPNAPARGASATMPPRALPAARRSLWSAANLALVLLILLTGFAAWRGLVEPRTSGGGGRPTVPAAGQDGPGRDAPLVAPPASPAPESAGITACDLSGDLPIIPDLTAEQFPLEQTALAIIRAPDAWQDPRGDLVLGCAGQEPVTLAEHVTSAGPGPWPGILAAWTLPPGTEDLARMMTTYVDLRTGALVTFGSPANDALVVRQEGSPWVMGPNPDDPGTTLVADLRTMQTRPLLDVVGLPELPGTTLVSSSPSGDGSIAIGFAATPSAGFHPTVLTGAELPGDLLLLGASLDDTRWVTLRDAPPGIASLSLSADGTHLAVVAMGDGRQLGGPYRYGLLELTSGEVVAVSAEIAFADNPFVAWVQGGRAAAYLNGDRLETLAVDGPGEPEIVFQAESLLTGLQTTRDPDVVVAATRRDHGSDAAPEQAERDIVYAIDLETGEARAFEGMDVSSWSGWITHAGALVMHQWDDANPETVTYAVVDPVTGSRIGEIVDAPTVQTSPRTLPTLGRHSFAVSADGSVEAIAFGTRHVYLFEPGPEGLTMRRIDAPDGLRSAMFLTANLALSPDGTRLALTGEEDEGRTRYLIALDDPNAEWIALENVVPGERGRGLVIYVDAG